VRRRLDTWREASGGIIRRYALDIHGIFFSPK
jgi:hypothetical protein